MSSKQSLKLGEDVEERIAWGIDLCTALNLLSVLPTDIPTQSKSDFIEQKLLFAIQQQGPMGYDITQALKYILNDQAQCTKNDKNLA